MRFKTPRAPEPAAPHWRVMAMTIIWLGGSAALLLAMVGNLIVQVAR